MTRKREKKGKKLSEAFCIFEEKKYLATFVPFFLFPYTPITSGPSSRIGQRPYWPKRPYSLHFDQNTILGS
jgi:hypothetical protein